MRAVFVLTVRQLAGSRRIWLVLALVSLPLLAGLLFQVANATATPDEFADDVTRVMLTSAILPLVMLLLATAAFGNEVGDRTLVYLVTKPIARWRIVAPKLLASVAVGGIPVALGGALAVAVIERGDGGGALATGAGLFAGAAAYAAIFTWAGLATRHALLIGLVYVFIWEAALAAYLDGIRFLSVRRYTLALIHGLDDGRLTSVDISLSPLTAVVGTTVVLVLFTALAVRKLVRMDVP
ncbi:MAG TPA: ABC transporter permease [Gaiellaceae bacterium]